jgi:hypothetical protein
LSGIRNSCDSVARNSSFQTIRRLCVVVRARVVHGERRTKRDVLRESEIVVTVDAPGFGRREREGAQPRRAQAALGQVIPTRKATSEVTLCTYLADTYEPWMKATYGQRTGQVTRIRAAFRELLDLKLSKFNTARIDRWRATRRSRHASDASKKNSREVSRSTINRNISALRAALAKAVEWGALSAMPLGKIKRKAEDESAVVRYLSDDEDARLRAALVGRDNTRRAARESANVWRRERGYEEWPAYGTYTDHLMPLVLLAVNTGLRPGRTPAATLARCGFAATNAHGPR